MILGFVVSQQGNLRSHLWFLLWLGKNMIIARHTQKDTQTHSEFDRHAVLLHLTFFSSYLFFRRSFFHRLLTRQASLASSHLERCFSRLCLAQLCCPSDAVGEECQTSKYYTGTDKRCQCSGGGMRIRDLIKEHRNTLVRLDKVRLQRRRRRREDLLHMSPPCFVCEPGAERGGYTRDAAPK